MDGQAFVLGLLALATVVVSVVLWSIFATARAKITARRDDAYEQLARRVVDAQERTTDTLNDLSRRLDAESDRGTRA